jgi:hypothetical protein
MDRNNNKLVNELVHSSFLTNAKQAPKRDSHYYPILLIVHDKKYQP